MSTVPLLEILAEIPDLRSRRGRIHPLTSMLSLAAVAMLADMKSLETIAQFGRDHGSRLAFALGFRTRRRRQNLPTRSSFAA